MQRQAHLELRVRHFRRHADKTDYFFLPPVSCWPPIKKFGPPFCASSWASSVEVRGFVVLVPGWCANVSLDCVLFTDTRRGVSSVSSRMTIVAATISVEKFYATWGPSGTECATKSA